MYNLTNKAEIIDLTFYVDIQVLLYLSSSFKKKIYEFLNGSYHFIYKKKNLCFHFLGIFVENQIKDEKFYYSHKHKCIVFGHTHIAKYF